MRKASLAVIAFSIGLSGCGMKPPAAGAGANTTATVSKGDIKLEVVETGTIDAVKNVEVKSRVSGRLKRLLVDAGDMVTAGQLIAVIDPQETQLQVRQNQAQVRGAESRVTQTKIEIEQRRATAQATLRQSEYRLSQLEREVRAQPILTSAAVRSAKAALDSAQQDLVQLEQTTQPNQRVTSEVAVREAEANLKNAEADYERQVQLKNDGFISQKAVENSGLALELARARLRSVNQNFSTLSGSQRNDLLNARQALIRAQAAYDQAKANTFQDEVKKKEYQSAQADLAKARIALRDVEALKQSNVQNSQSVIQLRSILDDSLRQLGETEIRAPMSGVVSQKLMQEGELVSGLSSFNSGSAIVNIEDRNTMRVNLSVNEIDTARLKLGMRAKVTVDAIPGQSFDGKVKKIAPTSVAASQVGGASADAVVKYDVEIWLDNSDPRLRSGMSARCSLTVSEQKNVLTLPSEFVGKDPKGSYVDIAATDPKGKPTRKDVTVGVTTNAKTEILTGVKEGDKVAKPKFTGPQRTGFMEGGPN